MSHFCGIFYSRILVLLRWRVLLFSWWLFRILLFWWIWVLGRIAIVSWWLFLLLLRLLLWWAIASVVVWIIVIVLVKITFILFIFF